MQSIAVPLRRSRFFGLSALLTAGIVVGACGGGKGGDGTGDGGTGGAGPDGGTGGAGPDGGLDDGSVETLPTAENDAYAVTGNVPIDVPLAVGALSNDAPEGGTLVGYGASTSTAADRAPGQPLTTALGGRVTMSADGAFSYEPPAGLTGADNFAYTLSNGHGASVATVAIEISNRIYFVDADAGPGGDGTHVRPFAALEDVTSGASGDVIYLGSTTTTYSAKALQPGQRLLGQGVPVTEAELGFGLAAHSRPLPAAGARPSMGTLTLASSSYVRGVDVAPPASSPGLVGSSISGIDVAAVSVRTSGAAGVSLSAVSGDVELGAVTTSGGLSGIELLGFDGSFLVGADATGSNDASGGTISSATGDGVVLSDASNVTLRSVRIEAASGYGVLASELGGTIDFVACSIDGGEVALHVSNQFATLERLSFEGGSIASTAFVGVEVQVLDAARLEELRVVNNLFTNAGSSFGGHAIAVVVAGAPATATPYAHAFVSNNTITGSSGSGIRLRSAEATGLLDAIVANNSVSAPTAAYPTQAIRVEAGSNTGASALCLSLSGNTAAGAYGAAGVGLRFEGTASNDSFGIVGLPAESTAGAALQGYVIAQNPYANGVDLVAVTSGFAPCIVP